MKKSAILFLLAMLSMMSQIFAHALWIEAPFTAVPGEQQTLKVYYGEYAHKEIEKVEDWYSDVREFALYLIAPDGKKTQLQTKANGDHFVAEFTPEQEGVYTLTVAHDTKFEGKTKYQFNTTATVAVGKSLSGKENSSGNDIATTLNGAGSKFKVNKPIELTTLLKSLPAEDISFEIFSPSGWNQQLTSGKDGKIVFTPLWKGIYMIEASKYRAEEGELDGAGFENVWRCATYLFEVK